jgi:hypothetical protein
LSHVSTGRGARLITMVAAALAGLSLAACSSPPRTASPTSGPTTSTSTAPTVTTTIPALTTTTTIPGCTGANYAFSLLGSQGAAGTFELTFGFKNTSSATCPLYGYPGIQLFDAAGTEIPTITDRGGGLSFDNFPPANIEVGPQESAYFNLGYSDVPTAGESSCPVATALQAIAPNMSVGLKVSGLDLQVCNNATVTVSPVFDKSSADTDTTAPPG